MHRHNKDWDALCTLITARHCTVDTSSRVVLLSSDIKSAKNLQQISVENSFLHYWLYRYSNIVLQCTSVLSPNASMCGAAGVAVLQVFFYIAFRVSSFFRSDIFMFSYFVLMASHERNHRRVIFKWTSTDCHIVHAKHSFSTHFCRKWHLHRPIKQRGSCSRGLVPHLGIFIESWRFFTFLLHRTCRNNNIFRPTRSHRAPLFMHTWASVVQTAKFSRQTSTLCCFHLCKNCFCFCVICVDNLLDSLRNHSGQGAVS